MKKRELAHEDRHVLCIYKSRNEEAQYMCSGTTCMKAFWALICKCFWALAHVQVFSVSTEKQVWKLLRQSFVKGHISSEVPRTAALNDLTHRNSNQPETSRSRQTCSVNDYVLIARRLQGADLMSVGDIFLHMKARSGLWLFKLCGDCSGCVVMCTSWWLSSQKQKYFFFFSFSGTFCYH